MHLCCWKFLLNILTLHFQRLKLSLNFLHVISAPGVILSHGPEAASAEFDILAQADWMNIELKSAKATLQRANKQAGVSLKSIMRLDVSANLLELKVKLSSLFPKLWSRKDQRKT